MNDERTPVEVGPTIKVKLGGTGTVTPPSRDAPAVAEPATKVSEPDGE